jgi:hypothetical protein
VIGLLPYHPHLNPIEKIWGIAKNCKNITFKLRDVQQLSEQNFAAVTMKEWAAICRHVKALEEEYISSEQEVESVMERITINVDDDGDNNDTSESSVSCVVDDDIQGVSQIFSDSE